MSGGPARQTSGRRENKEEEEEPFLLNEIPGSPRLFRGRRSNTEEERFVVEDIPGSPVVRGRRRNLEEERFFVQNVPTSSAASGRVPRTVTQERPNLNDSLSVTLRPVLNSSTDVGWDLGGNATNNNPARYSSRTRSTSTNNIINSRTNPGAPENEDAPPSYESTIPPNHVGWSQDVTSIFPVPMPLPVHNNDERLLNTFTYPSTAPYPTADMSPLPISHRLVEPSTSRSPDPSISPTSIHNPNRLRPSYTYQQRVIRSPARWQNRRESMRNGGIQSKEYNLFAYKYGAIFIAVLFVGFLMLLSLAAQFLIKRRFKY